MRASDLSEGMKAKLRVSGGDAVDQRLRSSGGVVEEIIIDPSDGLVVGCFDQRFDLPHGACAMETQRRFSNSQWCVYSRACFGLTDSAPSERE